MDKRINTLVVIYILFFTMAMLMLSSVFFQWFFVKVFFSIFGVIAFFVIAVLSMVNQK